MALIGWHAYKIRKAARELTKAARKKVEIHRDLLTAEQLAAIHAAREELVAGVRAKEKPARLEQLMRRLEDKLGQALPTPSHAGWRENVEVLLVAVIVAMAVRTFFLQPFKIPTGSMQPTLYGVYPPRYELPAPYPEGRRPNPVEQVIRLLLQGRISYSDGYRTIGDHIFVDKISYHFRPPQRGEVIVFKTGDIAEIDPASRGKFYIKRLVGLGGDRVRLQPPYAVVNGRILDSHPAFSKIYSRRDGYQGYLIPSGARYFRSERDEYPVPKDALFVLGDNSGSSADGRYWGAVPKRDLVGRAILVYWPFSRRWGPIE